MERKVGEIFELDGITLEVIDQPFDGHPKRPCEDCYFDGSVKCQYPRVFNIIGKCGARYFRTDKQNAMFKRIDNGTESR